MKQQTDRAFSVIGRWGCHFLPLAEMAEEITGKTLEDKQVMEVYAECVCSGLMGWNCYVLKPGRICSLFCYTLTGSVDYEVKYTGYWNLHDMVREVDHDYIVIRYKTKWGNHFVTERYNPDNRLELGEITGKRFFKVYGG